MANHNKLGNSAESAENVCESLIVKDVSLS